LLFVCLFCQRCCDLLLGAREVVFDSHEEAGVVGSHVIDVLTSQCPKKIQCMSFDSFHLQYSVNGCVYLWERNFRPFHGSLLHSTKICNYEQQFVHQLQGIEKQCANTKMAGK